jgi:hypothetical protein
MQQAVGTQKLKKNKVNLIEGDYDQFQKCYTSQTSASVKHSDRFKNRFNLKKEQDLLS